MGMFDYVDCEVPLPGLRSKMGNMQTKDFECSMSTYTIKEDGTLWTDCYGKPVQLAGYHGMLNFYAMERGGKWHEFNAKFTDGKLEGIEAIEESGP